MTIIIPAFIASLIFLSSLICFYLGYKLGKKNNYLSKRHEPLTTENFNKIFHLMEQYREESTDSVEERIAVLPEKQTDSADVGIVYRPTAGELKKMHEDQATKEAKAAIAETLRNTPEPKI